MDDITFFGSSDYNKNGEVSSEYPVWTFETHIDDLKESVASKERLIANGGIEPSELIYAKEALAKDKKRLEEIEVSRPTFSEAVSNKAYKEYKDLGEKISESLFTRSDMEKGLANPQEEMRRMSKPCITVSPDIAKMCNVRVGPDNKVNRNDASKIYKIVGHYFGENTNVEALRKDNKKR